MGCVSGKSVQVATANDTRTSLPEEPKKLQQDVAKESAQSSRQKTPETGGSDGIHEKEATSMDNANKPATPLADVSNIKHGDKDGKDDYESGIETDMSRQNTMSSDGSAKQSVRLQMVAAAETPDETGTGRPPTTMTINSSIQGDVHIKSVEEIDQGRVGSTGGESKTADDKLQETPQRDDTETGVAPGAETNGVKNGDDAPVTNIGGALADNDGTKENQPPISDIDSKNTDSSKDLTKNKDNVEIDGQWQDEWDNYGDEEEVGWEEEEGWAEEWDEGPWDDEDGWEDEKTGEKPVEELQKGNGVSREKGNTPDEEGVAESQKHEDQQDSVAADAVNVATESAIKSDQQDTATAGNVNVSTESVTKTDQQDTATDGTVNVSTESATKSDQQDTATDGNVNGSTERATKSDQHDTVKDGIVNVSTESAIKSDQQDTAIDGTVNVSTESVTKTDQQDTVGDGNVNESIENVMKPLSANSRIHKNVTSEAAQAQASLNNDNNVETTGRTPTKTEHLDDAQEAKITSDNNNCESTDPDQKAHQMNQEIQIGDNDDVERRPNSTDIKSDELHQMDHGNHIGDDIEDKTNSTMSEKTHQTNQGIPIGCDIEETKSEINEGEFVTDKDENKSFVQTQEKETSGDGAQVPDAETDHEVLDIDIDLNDLQDVAAMKELMKIKQLHASRGMMEMLSKVGDWVSRENSANTTTAGEDVEDDPVQRITQLRDGMANAVQMYKEVQKMKIYIQKLNENIEMVAEAEGVDLDAESDDEVTEMMHEIDELVQEARELMGIDQDQQEEEEKDEGEKKEDDEEEKQGGEPGDNKESDTDIAEVTGSKVQVDTGTQVEIEQEEKVEKMKEENVRLGMQVKERSSNLLAMVTDIRNVLSDHGESEELNEKDGRAASATRVLSSTSRRSRSSQRSRKSRSASSKHKTDGNDQKATKDEHGTSVSSVEVNGDTEELSLTVLVADLLASMIDEIEKNDKAIVTEASENNVSEETKVDESSIVHEKDRMADETIPIMPVVIDRFTLLDVADLLEGMIREIEKSDEDIVKEILEMIVSEVEKPNEAIVLEVIDGIIVKIEIEEETKRELDERKKYYDKMRREIVDAGEVRMAQIKDDMGIGIHKFEEMAAGVDDEMKQNINDEMEAEKQSAEDGLMDVKEPRLTTVQEEDESGSEINVIEQMQQMSSKDKCMDWIVDVNAVVASAASDGANEETGAVMDSTPVCVNDARQNGATIKSTSVSRAGGKSVDENKTSVDGESIHVNDTAQNGSTVEPISVSQGGRKTDENNKSVDENNNVNDTEQNGATEPISVSRAGGKSADENNNEDDLNNLVLPLEEPEAIEEMMKYIEKTSKEMKRANEAAIDDMVPDGAAQRDSDEQIKDGDAKHEDYVVQHVSEAARARIAKLTDKMTAAIREYEANMLQEAMMKAGEIKNIPKTPDVIATPVDLERMTKDMRAHENNVFDDAVQRSSSNPDQVINEDTKSEIPEENKIDNLNLSKDNVNLVQEITNDTQRVMKTHGKIYSARKRPRSRKDVNSAKSTRGGNLRKASQKVNGEVVDKAANATRARIAALTEEMTNAIRTYETIQKIKQQRMQTDGDN